MEVKNLKTQRSERTRRRLLRVSQKLFSRSGFAGTSLDHVAVGAGVTKGAIYHQFRDKRELFEAAVRERVEDIVRTTRKRSAQWVERDGRGQRSWSRALFALQILLDALSEPANRRILLVEAPAVLGRERWQLVWGEEMPQLVRGLSREAVRRGHMEPDLMEPTAHMFSGALQEAALAIGHSEDPTRARAEFEQAGRWILQSVLRPDRQELAEADEGKTTAVSSRG